MNKYLKSAFLTALFICSSAAFAAGGLDVESKFQTIWTVMKSCGVILATIAVGWAGYKIFWKGANIGDISGPLVGGILVGAAPWIADLVINGTI